MELSLEVPESPEKLSLEESWAYKVTLLADLIARNMARAVQNVSGLNLSQWRVLAAIADRPGRTVSEVVAITPMDKGIVSRAVSSLVESGLLERSASQKDGRISFIHLTNAGLKVYELILTEIDQNKASGRNLLTDAEEKKLLDDLDELISHYTRATDQ